MGVRSATVVRRSRERGVVGEQIAAQPGLFVDHRNQQVLGVRDERYVLLLNLLVEVTELHHSPDCRSEIQQENRDHHGNRCSDALRNRPPPARRLSPGGIARGCRSMEPPKAGKRTHYEGNSTGGPMRKPCINSTPRSTETWSSCVVSTPSAMTVAPA